jgi:Ras-related protein Rab-1A
MSVNYDHLYKILLIGDSGVGKSSIIMRYTENTFSEKMQSTIGVDFKITTIKHNNKTIKLQIWDTAGQERFRTVTTSYYRGAHAVIVVFDLTSMDSFLNVKQWIEEVNSSVNNSQKSVHLILVGTKSDLVSKIRVPQSNIKTLVAKLGIEYVETSAKSNIGINDIFVKICDLLVTNQIPTDNHNKLTNSILLNVVRVPVNEKQSYGYGCCSY